MYVKPRPILTAGIAALSVGAIALSPVQPIPNHVSLEQQRVVSDLAIDLAATVNPIVAWVDTLQATAANLTTLGTFALQQPFPIAQTLIHNWGVYLQEILSGNIKAVFDQIGTNFQTFFKAPFDVGATTTLNNCDGPCDYPPVPGTVTSSATLSFASIEEPFYINDVVTEGNVGPATTLNLLALQVYAGASQADPVTEPADYAFWQTLAKLAPVLRFTQTVASGAIMGLLGPVLSPVASVLNSLTSFGRNLKAGNLLDAVYDVINIPANITNAFFNGAWLNLSPLIELAGFNLHDPDSAVQIGNVGLGLGGLLNATAWKVDEVTGKTLYNAGTLFGEIAGDANDPGPCGSSCFLPSNRGTVGNPAGLGGAFVGMGQYLAGALRVSPVVKAKTTAAAARAADATPVVTDTPDVAAPESESVDAAPAVADTATEAKAPEAKAPAASAPAHRKAARASAAKSGDNEHASGHSRSARSSR